MPQAGNDTQVRVILMSHDTTSLTNRRPRSANSFDLVPHDLDVINLDIAGEVAYWCANFRCTGSELRAAVEAVGSASKTVANHLRSLAGRSTGADPGQCALNESSVREVVESMLRTLLEPPDCHMFRELLERAVAHPLVVRRTNQRWVSLSSREAGIAAQVVATIVSNARLGEREGI